MSRQNLLKSGVLQDTVMFMGFLNVLLLKILNRRQGVFKGF